MSEQARKEGFVPPPHINAEAHKRVMEWLRQASPEEVFQSAVRAGIYTPDGKLTEPYRDSEDDRESEREKLESGDEHVTVKVPKELVPAVQNLLAKHAG